MVLDSIMKEINSFCKNDDTCVLIILVLVGFLLCMLFKRNEGFLNFANLDELDKEQQEMKDIGKKPESIGIQLSENRPVNGYGPLEKKINIARQGPQYNSKKFNQPGAIDISQVGLPVAYDWNRKGGYYNFEGQMSDFGMNKPMNAENIMKTQPMGDQNKMEPNKSGNKLKLVLFYAPWCGHSKRMLKDYDNVISQYHNKDMNGYNLEIIKIDMDTNPDAAKQHNVEVKGFPTLYTFTNVNGKEVSQVFNFREEDKIIEELKRRTSS